MPHDPAGHTSAAAPADQRGRIRLGFALLLLSALLFSLHNTLARLAYDEGVGPTTINGMRTWAMLLFFVLVLGAQGHWPRLPRAAWLVFALTAIGYAVHNPLLLIAFQFIPVGLAVLVLYVFPLIVALMAAGIGQERLRPVTLAAAVVGFAGVALVLNVGDVALDWRGIALAGVAAVALSVNVVGAAQLNRHMSALAVPFALSVVGAIVFGALMFADGGPTLPGSARGWAIFAAATIASPGAILAFYFALPRAGAPRSSVVLNIEPVITVLFAAWLLGETLTALQGFGGALIVGAIVAAALARLRARAG